MTRDEQIATVKARREAAGMSIESLARLSVTSDWTVTRLENGGGCSPQELERILSALPIPEDKPASVAGRIGKAIASVTPHIGKTKTR
jgi:transcriptional regulator with XRE-family HTH domain